MGPYGAAPSPYGPPPNAAPFGPMGMQMSAPYGIEPMTGMPYSDKSKVVGGLLQLFLGWCGVGRFYTGHIGIGIAQIVVVWASCGIGIIWPIVDGIMMLTGRVTDAEGRPLRDG
jgi:TM2 domain-containing membrane protein YozV